MLPYWKKKKKKEPKTIYGHEVRTKRKPNLVKKLDKVFSLYIRLRDVMPNGYGTCIACGRPKHFTELDCGHYHSRMHMATRYDEDNCHAECRYCNRMSADHIIKYERNLVRKIGQHRVDLLMVKASSTKHYLDCELEQMIKYYTAEVKKLSSLKGIKVNL